MKTNHVVIYIHMDALFINHNILQTMLILCMNTEEAKPAAEAS